MYRQLQSRLSVNHVSIVNICDAGLAGDDRGVKTLFFASEHVVGDRLSTRIENLTESPLSLRDILFNSFQVIEGLTFLH